MRTTIDIPARLRQRLVNAAAERNLKGFSPIIEEALTEYFEKRESSGAREGIRALRGTLTGEEYRQAVEVLEAGRAEWKIS